MSESAQTGYATTSVSTGEYPADLFKLSSQTVLDPTVHVHTSRASPLGIEPTSQQTKVMLSKYATDQLNPSMQSNYSIMYPKDDNNFVLLTRIIFGIFFLFYLYHIWHIFYFQLDMVLQNKQLSSKLDSDTHEFSCQCIQKKMHLKLVWNGMLKKLPVHIICWICNPEKNTMSDLMQLITTASSSLRLGLWLRVRCYRKFSAEKLIAHICHLYHAGAWLWARKSLPKSSAG